VKSVIVKTVANRLVDFLHNTKLYSEIYETTKLYNKVRD